VETHAEEGKAKDKFAFSSLIGTRRGEEMVETKVAR
jgi:hypothetical protein